MKTFTLAAIAAAAVACGSSAQTVRDSALRRVDGRTVTSPVNPRATIEVSEGLRYVGGQQFVLYGVANAEQHFFVDASGDGTVRRLYWLQFEGYLPDNTSQYRYASPDVRRIGPFDFFVDVLTGSGSQRPDSDGAHMRRYLQEHGLKLTERGATVRFVHLTDATKRHELMIIYREGRDENQAAESEALIARGMSGLRIKSS
jgi:hypothetical protein